LPNSVNRFFQQPARVTDTLQGNLLQIAVCSVPMTVSLSSLSTKRCQFFGMRVKEAQAPFHSGRLARTTSLRLSLAPLPTPLF
jgi:hypothetical protein